MTSCALVLFSGGQDSTMAIAWALENFDHVETLGFKYGQENHLELRQRPIILQDLCGIKPEWGKRLGQDHVLGTGDLCSLASSTLTAGKGELRSGVDPDFVPGRNLLFLQTACSLAYVRNIDTIVMGAFHADAQSLPDCDDDLLAQFTRLCARGLGAQLKFVSPYYGFGKKRLWDEAQSLGGTSLVDLVRIKTHSCYRADRRRQDWGAGCGSCSACKSRKIGWEAFQQCA